MCLSVTYASPTGMAYVFQCADMEYYNKAEKDCEEFACDVSYCTESLCNAPN